MRSHLDDAGRDVPDRDTAPSGAELIADLIEPLGALPEIRSRLTLQAQVVAVARAGLLKHEVGAATRAARPFRLMIDTADGEAAGSADMGLDRVDGT